MKIPTVRRPPVAALLATCLGLCLATGVVAGPPPASTSSTVSLAGIDLSTAAGRQEAHERLRREALRLCRQVVNSAFVESQQALSDCVSDALAPHAARLAAPQRLAQSR